MHCVCGHVFADGEHSEFRPLPTAYSGVGPGTEMIGIMQELGIQAKLGCSCLATAKKMDKLGVNGCELNRDWIVSQLEANAAKWSWLETLQIAASNALNPLALAIAFRGNIYHALLDEAIARAKAKAS